MSENQAKAVLDRLQGLKSDRGTLDEHCREVAERCLFRQNDFAGSQTKGDKRTQKSFDSTAARALEKFAAAMESMLTPRNKRWHRLTASNEELRKNKEVEIWFDQINKSLFRQRYHPKANYAGQNHENLMALGAFGTACLFIDENTGGGDNLFRYKSLHLSNYYVAEDHTGKVDTLFIIHKLSARAAAKKYGEENLPPEIKKAVEKEPDRMFEFVQAIQPNDEMDRSKLDYRGMAYASTHVSVVGPQVVKRGGFHTFPGPVSRYVTAPNETYGRSPAMTALPDIKTLDQINKTSLRAAQRAVEPPLLLHGKMVGYPVRQTPGANNYNGMTDDGKPLAYEMGSKSRQDVAFEWMDQKRGAINDAFLVSLFQILVDTPTMTATEALERAREKGQLLAPTMGRQQSEYLGPKIERELDIMVRRGMVPEMPPLLAEAEGEYDIVYESDMMRAQSADEVVALAKWMELYLPLAEFDPIVMRTIKWAEASLHTAPIVGVPPHLVASYEDVEAAREEMAKQQALQEAAQAAPALAQAAKQGAEAQAVASGR